MARLIPCCRLLPCPRHRRLQPHREAVRAVDCSQFGSGAFCDADPDASLPRLKQASHKLIPALLQHRLGLYISSAKPAFDTLAAAGEPVDYLGDTLCNSGNHHDRHDVGVRAWRDAAAAVATGPVHLCDKKDRARNRHYCEHKVPDLTLPGASPWGTDVLIECIRPRHPSPQPSVLDRVGRRAALLPMSDISLPNLTA